jgi:2-succinyl-6-hydroxy-2,4-cyclohexadiene-1-carboxylate synthase
LKIALIHGFAGQPRVWDDVIAAWPRADELVAIGLPGHGGPLVAETWNANLDAIGAGLRDAEVVVGYSLGARVALGLVVRGLAPRGVLIGVGPGIDDAERPARSASDAHWAHLLRTRGIAAFADAWSALPLFATQARVTAERRAARRAWRLELDPEQLARSLEVMGLAAMPDYRGAITAHADRLALIAGDDDAKYVAIARASPLPLETIAGSGHDPTLEQPAALAAALARLIG